MWVQIAASQPAVLSQTDNRFLCLQLNIGAHLYVERSLSHILTYVQTVTP